MKNVLLSAADVRYEFVQPNWVRIIQIKTYVLNSLVPIQLRRRVSRFLKRSAWLH